MTDHDAVPARPLGPSGSPLVGRGDVDRTAVITRSLLGYGLVAGPFYVVVGLVQALVRNGFDLAHHDLSLLANGSGGWVQIANLVLTGLMVIAAGVGMRRSCRALRERSAGAWLVMGYGVGLVGAGILPADPMNGFPPGTPDGGPLAPTIAGTGHLVLGGLGFLALIAACVLHARRLRAAGRTGLSLLSVVTGVLFLLAFGGLTTGSSSAVVVLGFWVALLLSWTWLALVSLDLYRRTPLLTPAG